MLEIFYKKCKENRLNPLKEWKASNRDARFIMDDTYGGEKL
jgi:hypothetical protein